MAFGIIRVEKIKATAVGALMGRAKHNLREGREPSNVDPDKIKDNLHEGAQTSQEVLKVARGRWSKIDGAIRSDAVGCLEVMVTISKNNEVNEKKYLADAKKFVQGLYGKENVLTLSIHMDEDVSHLHALIVPLEKKIHGNNKNGVAKTRLNAQKIFKNRDSLRQLQDNFYNQVSKKYGLERGRSAEETNAKNSRPNLDKRANEQDIRENELDQKEIELVENYRKRIKAEFKADYVQAKDDLPIPDKKETAKNYRKKIVPMFDAWMSTAKQRRLENEELIRQKRELKQSVPNLIRNEVAKSTEPLKVKINELSKSNAENLKYKKMWKEEKKTSEKSLKAFNRAVKAIEKLPEPYLQNTQDYYNKLKANEKQSKGHER